MAGFNRHTGKEVSDIDHLYQSIMDILTTPIGSRVMLRDYGSQLFDLIDTPMNQSGIMDIYQSVVKALAIWEPRLSVTNVQITPSKGKISINLNGIYRPNGQNIKMTGIEVQAL